MPRRIAAVMMAVIALAAGLIIGKRLVRHRPPRVPDPRFYTLGELGQELANDPATFDAVLDKFGGSGGRAVGALTQTQVASMRALYAAANWEELDLQPTTDLDTLGKGLGLLADRRKDGAPAPPAAEQDAVGTEPFGIPTGQPAITGEPLLEPIGLELTWGDRVDKEKAARYADSRRLADVLEHLSLNDDENPERYAVTMPDGAEVDSPVKLIEALRKMGHEVKVVDQRLAANFGDLERKGRAVATPLWVSTGREADGEPLALPVPHAQLVLQVRGDPVNADATFYPSLDLAGEGGGGAVWRADYTADQPWCGGIVAHTWEKDQATEAVRLMGLMRRELARKVRDKKLPLDGYFALGVCTLSPAVVEQALTGATTVWPLTHDPALFDGEGELDTRVKRLPHDGRGAPAPDDARLKGSLPWAKLSEVPFPLLREQVDALGWLK